MSNGKELGDKLFMPLIGAGILIGATILAAGFGLPEVAYVAGSLLVIDLAAIFFIWFFHARAKRSRRT